MPVTELRPPARRSSSTRFEPAALPPRRPRALPPVRIRPEDLQDPFPDFTEQIDQRALAAARRAHPSGRSGGRSGQAPAPRVTAKPARAGTAGQPATPGTARQTGRAGAAPLAQPALSGGRAGGSGSRSIASARGLPAAVGAAALLASASRLNLFAVGEENAAALGVDTERSKAIIFVASSLLTGAAVAFAGVIGFVGLLVPHAARAVAGNDQRVLLPLSAVSGAALLVAADALSRFVAAPSELPIGAVTAAIGAPVFVYLLLRTP